MIFVFLLLSYQACETAYSQANGFAVILHTTEADLDGLLANWPFGQFFQHSFSIHGGRVKKHIMRMSTRHTDRFKLASLVFSHQEEGGKNLFE